jgi:hypothetical protein
MYLNNINKYDTVQSYCCIEATFGGTGSLVESAVTVYLLGPLWLCLPVAACESSLVESSARWH